MQMRSDKIFGDLFMHIYCRVRWWKNFIFGRYLAKLYTRVYSVSISDVLFDQQLLPRNLLHTCHTLCLKKYRLTLDVWQWLLKMWTDFQNSFTIWFVWKFSMYKPQINSKIKKNITEFPRLMWTCHKYTILFTFVCYVFVVVDVVNFPEICQSCYWQWVDCNLLMFCSQWSAHNCCHRHLTSVGLHSTTLFAIYTVFQQEAQLLQRDRARRFLSLNILLSHSRSLKVIRNDTGA